jgi:pyruvate kinase
MKAIVTIPPYAGYVPDLMRQPTVSGARLNTVMPLKGGLEDEIRRMKDLCCGKDLWIDLKTRQMRITRHQPYGAPTKPIMLEVNGRPYVFDPQNPKVTGQFVTAPWHSIQLDHKIRLDLSKPVRCYFSDGIDAATVVGVVDGDKLITLEGPQRVVGSGESVNILHPSLVIEGDFLTERDKEYVAAARKAGVHTYMLSYVEQPSDITDLLALDPEARIVAKIESKKGLQYVASGYAVQRDNVRLMAARGDLFVEVERPHRILEALRQIVEADPAAIAASRIFPGLRNSPYPSCPDICDIGYLTEIGYETAMVGDDICFNEDSVMSAVHLLAAIDGDYTPRTRAGATDATIAEHHGVA